MAKGLVTYLNFEEGEVFVAPKSSAARGDSQGTFKTAQDTPIFSEFAPLRIASPLPVPVDNPNITFEVDKKDFTIGAAKYRSAKRIDQNLSMQGRNPMPHTSIEVRFTGQNGALVPMARRLVKIWSIVPTTPAANVADLTSWRIEGLEHTEFLPFSPFPIRKENPMKSFGWDHPTQGDAPGFLGSRGNLGAGAGTLQEFIAGNGTVGGVYYQVYTLADRQGVRVFNTEAFAFDPAGYRKLMNLLADPGFQQKQLHKLLFMPKLLPGHDKSVRYPTVPTLVPAHGASLSKPRAFSVPGMEIPR